MLAQVRTTVLPSFSVDVYPLTDEEHVSHQPYVLVLRDETAGTMELMFSSGQDLRAFLRDTRDAFSAAKQEVEARKTTLRPRFRGCVQPTLF